MMTLRTLKTGDFVKTRYKGSWEFAILCEPHGTMTCRELIEESAIPKGAEVFECVWKKEQLEPRKVTVKRDGPATFVRPGPQPALLEKFGYTPLWDETTKKSGSAPAMTPKNLSMAELFATPGMDRYNFGGK